MSSSALYLVLGDPVHHSLSPAIHNAAFRELGIDAVYGSLRLGEELVGPVMRELAASGGGGNVTLPHKRTAARALDQASEAVEATGACNVFWWEVDRGLCGDNTDVAAFRVAAESLLESKLEGLKILLLGAGGAARAVLYACLQDGVEHIAILNRTEARAQSLLHDFDDPASACLLTDGSALASSSYDLVVNATTLGLRGSDPLPLEIDALRANAVFDLVYGQDKTAFVGAARAAGIRAEDGRRMLAEQAAASFRLWFDRSAPLELMYKTVGLS